MSSVIPIAAFTEGDLVRSTNELHMPFGIGRIQTISWFQTEVEDVDQCFASVARDAWRGYAGQCVPTRDAGDKI